ncbi:MAG: DUF86 domain-containing protein [Alphaproteobacteria bacterium]
MRGDRERLQDIRISIDDIQEFVAGMTKSQFLKVESADRKTYRAICNCISTLGEAIKTLSPDVTSKYDGVDWPGLAGMKDVVTHQYFQVQLEFLWNTITHELPELRAIVVSELARD